MQKQTWLKNINKAIFHSLDNKTIHQAQWPVRNVLAFTTSRLSPFERPDFPQPTSLCNNQYTHHKYDHFNLGDHVGDDLARVNYNRQSLHKLLLENVHIQWLKQVHGNQVLTLTQDNITCTTPLEADAVITREKKIVLSIMTADCLPILLSSKSGDEIAAIHGGWRPMSLDIIKQTLDKMQTPASELHVWLGPCIGSDAFEVGAEVKQAFTDMFLQCESAFKSVNGATGKYLADLQRLATILLNNHGVKNISTLADCTFTLAEQYNSYRRDGQTGRMATLICRN